METLIKLYLFNNEVKRGEKFVTKGGATLQYQKINTHQFHNNEYIDVVFKFKLIKKLDEEKWNSYYSIDRRCHINYTFNENNKKLEVLRPIIFRKSFDNDRYINLFEISHKLLSIKDKLYYL